LILLVVLWHNRGLNSEVYSKIGLLRAYELTQSLAFKIGLISGITTCIIVYFLISEMEMKALKNLDQPIETYCLVYIALVFWVIGFLPFIVLFLIGVVPLSVLDHQFLAIFGSYSFILSLSSYYHILFRKKQAYDEFNNSSIESFKLEFNYWLQVVTFMSNIGILSTTGILIFVMSNWYFNIDDSIRLSAPFRIMLFDIMLIFIIGITGVWWGLIGGPWSRLHYILKEIRRIEISRACNA